MQGFMVSRLKKRAISPPSRKAGTQNKRFMVNCLKKRGLNPCSTVGVQKEVGNNVCDKLSQLPDEVLVTILSLLTMREAASTSILSSRWRKLWTTVPLLNFDAAEALRSLDKLSDELIALERIKYIDWVNIVLNSYQAPSIHEFCVRFDLDANDSCHIDTWVKFAIEKNVRCLTMHFAKRSFGYRGENHYHFPPLCTFSDYTSLTKLDLKYVDISDEVIQHFLSSCPHLDELAIKASLSQQLVNLIIAGQSLCLKHLKIVCCPFLKTIYLSAPNLSSFEFSGGMVDISYANVPNLVDVTFGDDYLESTIYNFPQLSKYVMHLQTLTLNVGYIKSNMRLGNYPELPYLTTLKLDVMAADDKSILVFAPLIERATSLHKLVLELSWYESKYMWKRKAVKTSKSPHKCLKELEIAGFVGKIIDMEFATYLLENAIALEKVTLDCLTSHGLSVDLKCRKFAMTQAMFLKSKFSLGNKLVTRIL